MVADVVFRVNVLILSRFSVEDRLGKIEHASIKIDHQSIMGLIGNY